VPEAGSRRAAVAAAAMTLLEERGPEAVTMRAVAARVGIKAPSLYKHFPDKLHLEAALVAEGFRRTAAVFVEAVSDTPDPLGSLARAYRTWGTTNPHLYRLMHQGPLRRDLLPPGVEDAAAAPLVAATGHDPDLARAAWALAHGLTSLELDRRFPPGADVDAAWEAGIGALRRTVADVSAAQTADRTPDRP
jgi:AcrR family transcriptional regulator